MSQPPPPAEKYAPTSRHRRRSAQPQPSARLVPAVYASWLVRVLAWIVDTIPAVVILGIGFGLMLGTRTTQCSPPPTEYDLGDFCSTGASVFGQSSMTVAALLALAYLVWNYGYRQGVKGSTVGKSVARFKVVSESSGLPIGFGRSIVRQLAHFLDAIPFCVGFLFPIWDVKRRTFADRIMTTVCVPTR